MHRTTSTTCCCSRAPDSASGAPSRSAGAPGLAGHRARHRELDGSRHRLDRVLLERPERPVPEHRRRALAGLVPGHPRGARPAGAVAHAQRAREPVVGRSDRGRGDDRVAAALAYGPVIHYGSAGDLSAAVLTGLAYPVGDLLLLGMVVAIFGLSGWRPGRAWIVLGLGLALNAVGDGIYLLQTAEGTWQDGIMGRARSGPRRRCSWAWRRGSRPRSRAPRGSERAGGDRAGRVRGGGRSAAGLRPLLAPERMTVALRP